MTQFNLERLKDPFPASDIEWRVARAGKTDKGVWAQVLAYVTNRAIMDRLDEVCGPDRWWNTFKRWDETSQLCGITIVVDGEVDDWIGRPQITKWDGAPNTEIEPVKGGLSDSMKRAAVQWGIGRYLYSLGQSWAEILPDRQPGCKRDKFKDKQTKEDVWFFWLPPSLPDWATPGPKLSPDTQPDPKIDTEAFDKAKAHLQKSADNAQMLLRCIMRLPTAKGTTKGQRDLLGIMTDSLLVEKHTFSQAHIALTQLNLKAGPSTQLNIHLKGLQKEHDWK